MACAAVTLLAASAPPLLAARPKDTLVVAAAFDDIISLDPAEAFERLYQQTEVAADRGNVEGLKIGPTSDSTSMFAVAKK